MTRFCFVGLMMFAAMAVFSAGGAVFAQAEPEPVAVADQPDAAGLGEQWKNASCAELGETWELLNSWEKGTNKTTAFDLLRSEAAGRVQQATTMTQQEYGVLAKLYGLARTKLSEEQQATAKTRFFNRRDSDAEPLSQPQEHGRLDLMMRMRLTPEEMWKEETLQGLIDTHDRVASWEKEWIRNKGLYTFRREAARRLVEDESVVLEADYDLLLRLCTVGQWDLDAEKMATIKARLASRPEEDGAFGKMRGRHKLILRTGFSRQEAEEMVATWMEAKDLQFLSTGELQWLRGELDASRVSTYKKLSVVWTGFIEAPRTGQYTFSTCPINVNFKHIDWFVRSSMTVSIDGGKVLDSTADGWAPTGSPVTLQAGQRKSVRVEYRYEHAGNGIFWPATAMLYWEGPGTERQLVPAGALFTTGAGDDAGLRGQYTGIAGEAEITDVQTDPQVDFTWPCGDGFLPKFSQEQTRLAEELNARYTDADHLADFAPATAEKGTFLPNPALVAERMNSQQRAGFLAAVAADQALVEALSWRETQRIYTIFRPGALDEALAFLGTWMQLHPNPEPEFAENHFNTNRRGYYDVARSMVWEYKPHWEQLEDAYLELPDGGCCLPAAYTVAYGYWAQGRISEWLETLDTRLADESLTGGRRVNWLVARAHAEEFHRSTVGRHFLPYERLHIGRGWLDEASLVAQDEATGLRISKEKATRMNALNDSAALEAVFEHAEGRYTSAASQAAVADWRTQVTELSTRLAEKQRQQQERSWLAYAEKLEQRRGAAEQRGDRVAVEAFKREIDAAKEEAAKYKKPETPTP